MPDPINSILDTSNGARTEMFCASEYLKSFIETSPNHGLGRSRAHLIQFLEEYDFLGDVYKLDCIIHSLNNKGYFEGNIDDLSRARIEDFSFPCHFSPYRLVGYKKHYLGISFEITDYNSVYCAFHFSARILYTNDDGSFLFPYSVTLKTLEENQAKKQILWIDTYHDYYDYDLSYSVHFNCSTLAEALRMASDKNKEIDSLLSRERAKLRKNIDTLPEYLYEIERLRGWMTTHGYRQGDLSFWYKNKELT